MSKRFAYLFYASLVFLAVALYKADYLRIPEVRSPGLLAISLGLLCAGFLVSARSWQAVLRASGHAPALGTCVSSVGLSIFGKYVPGKIWIIVGRAAYVADRIDARVMTLSAISLSTQLITLWVALLLGVAGLLSLGGLHVWGWLIGLSWLALTIVIFGRAPHRLAERCCRAVLRRDVTIPRLDLASTLRVIPWFALNWIVWAAGFYLLAASLLAAMPPLSVGLALPLATAIGIVSVFAPGGLGVREAVLAGYLALAGISIDDAATISVASRLWFLIGEGFIFLVGWLLHRRSGP